MSFDKKLYWDRRNNTVDGVKKPLRGQGETEKSEITPGKPGSYSIGMKRVNRATYRRKSPNDPNTTKKYLRPQKTTDQLLATQARVKRKEAGERERIAKKKAGMANE